MVFATIRTIWKKVPMKMIATFGASASPKTATISAPNTGAGMYRMKSIGGSTSLATTANVPASSPSGTPTAHDQKNPQKITRRLWPMLSWNQMSSRSCGGSVKTR